MLWNSFKASFLETRLGTHLHVFSARFGYFTNWDRNYFEITTIPLLEVKYDGNIKKCSRKAEQTRIIFYYYFSPCLSVLCLVGGF